MTTDVSSAKEGAQQPGRDTSPVGSGTLLGLADGRIVETRSDPARGTPDSLDGIDDLTWDSDRNSAGHGGWVPPGTRWLVYGNEMVS
jgi:hypothetical protein